MSNQQVWCVVAVFLLLAIVTGAEMLHWLPSGRAKFAIVFLTGIGLIALLRIAGIPPQWFSGRTAGFSLALTLLLGGVVTRGAETRAFGMPLLTGMGGTLFLLNAWAFVLRIR